MLYIAPIMKRWFEFLRLDDYAKRTFNLLVALSFLYALPIIWADYYFTDDWRRSMAGFASWEWDGRPLTSLLMSLLSFGTPLLDIFPIPLLLGLLILCYSLVLFARRYFEDYAPLYTACVLFFFIANPFLLENLSFKYDSLSMCMALASVILIFSHDNTIGLLKLFVISTICILITLNLYQPALCSFFCFLLIKILFDVIQKRRLKDIAAQIVCLVSSCLLSLVIYKSTTVSYYFHNKAPEDFWNNAVSGYAKMHSSLIDTHYIDLIYSNIRNFMHMIGAFLKGVPDFLVLIGMLLISAFIIVLVFNVLRKNQYNLSRYQKILFSICILACPLLILLNTFLFMTILKNPIFTCRVMLSFGCFLLVIGIAIYYLSKFSRIANVFLIPFIAFVFMFSFAYGNVIKNQKNYDIVLMQKLSYDIERIDMEHHNRKDLFISFWGKPPISKQLSLACSRFPVMNYLFYRYVSEEWPFITYILPNYIKHDAIMGVPVDSKDIKFMNSREPAVKNSLYKIYIRKHKLIINFKNVHS